MYIITVGVTGANPNEFEKFIPVDKHGFIINNINEVHSYSSYKDALEQIKSWTEKVLIMSNHYQTIYKNTDNKKFGFWDCSTINGFNTVLEDISVYSYAEYVMAQHMTDSDGNLTEKSDDIIHEYFTRDKIDLSLIEPLVIFNITDDMIDNMFNISINSNTIYLTLK